MSAHFRRGVAREAPGYDESSERAHTRRAREARRARLLRGTGADQARASIPAPAEARRAPDRPRGALHQVRWRPLQGQVPVVDVDLRGLLRLVRRLVVRDRADRAPVRARDGPRHRGEAPGPAGERSALHPVPRRADHAQADATQRLERGEAGDRGADPRLTRRRRHLDRGRGLRLEPPEGARLPRVLPQPLQPAARGTARRRANRQRAAPGALARRLSRAARARLPVAEPDPDHHPDRLGDGALDPLAHEEPSRAPGVLQGRPRQRAIVAVLYFGLAVLLVLGMERHTWIETRSADEGRAAPREPRGRAPGERPLDRPRVLGRLLRRREDRPARGLGLRLRARTRGFARLRDARTVGQRFAERAGP